MPGEIPVRLFRQSPVDRWKVARLLQDGDPLHHHLSGVRSAKTAGLFGQLSVVAIETESQKDVYPEDLVELVDRHALSPVYSFLTQEDQEFAINKIHTERKTSVVMLDEIREELARNRSLDFYSVNCSNFGMLHSHSTMIGTEKSMWVPFSGYEDTDV